MPGGAGAALGVCLAALALARGAAGAEAGAREEADAVARARCAARCLSLWISLEGNGSLAWCEQHGACSACLEPCRDPRDLNSQQCHTSCQRSPPAQAHECRGSCAFLAQARAVKQGACAAPARARGFAAACVESCAGDGDCAGDRKCCGNGCGRTCQAARGAHRGTPLRPRRPPRVRELPPPGRLVQLSWWSRFNVSLEPAVNLVQGRCGRGHGEDGGWRTAAQTTDARVRVSVRPGRWCQFRVAAVNAQGTRGFTAPSAHFRSSRAPSAPPAPVHLRVLSATEDEEEEEGGEEGAVAVALAWALPADPDLPVHHYRVSWSPARPGGRRRTLTAEGPPAVLRGLRPGAEYALAVRAVSLWGGARLKGPRAALRFRAEPRGVPGKPSQAPPGPVRVGAPAYRDGNLGVRVSWNKPEGVNVTRYEVQWWAQVCAGNRTPGSTPSSASTQARHLVLRSLSFSCEYRVSVRALGAPAHTVSFFTPDPGFHLLSKPENLSASFAPGDAGVSARFSWTWLPPPSSSSSLPEAFRVTWAQVNPGGGDNDLPGSMASGATTLPPDRFFLTVPSLRPATLYRVEVRALTAEGEGPAAAGTFQTPELPAASSPHSQGPLVRPLPPSARHHRAPGRP